MKKFKKSLKCAFRGIIYVIKNERNFRIELMIAAVIVFLIFFIKLKGWEAIILILMIMWVLITELINTVLERVVDILKPRIHPYARLVKDIMASVVLISCLIAVIVGVVIFLPYFREIF